jgi:transcription elongation GreA/GreB family factor
LEDGHVSVSSPLGSAFLDKKPKDVVEVKLPFGTRRLKIVRLLTLHDAVSEDA